MGLTRLVLLLLKFHKKRIQAETPETQQNVSDSNPLKKNF